MNLNIQREAAAMQRMGAKELRPKYAEVFGEQTPANNKVWLIRRIAWRLQAQAELRVRKVRGQIHDVHRRLIDEEQAASTPALFDPVWQALTPAEQARPDGGLTMSAGRRPAAPKPVRPSGRHARATPPR